MGQITQNTIFVGKKVTRRLILFHSLLVVSALAFAVAINLLNIMIIPKVYSRFLMGCNPSLVSFLTLIEPPVLSEQAKHMMLGKFLATHLPAIYNIITLGIERNEFIVTDETRIVPGVTTTVVWDRVQLDNELIEETYDWYAQDRGGNVWYFGEDSKEYENRRLLSTKNCGEAGVDGAKPGIIIEGNPKVVDSYKQ